VKPSKSSSKSQNSHRTW